MAKKKHVYVYHDGDHGDIEIFDTLQKAKDYTEIHWPCDDMESQDRWEGDIEVHGEIQDLESQYVVIYKREVRTNIVEN